MALPRMIEKSGPTLVNMAVLPWLEALQQAQRQRQRLIRSARDYYNGDHPTLLTPRQREYLNIHAGMNFCMNYCRLVVDAPVERLHVTGFRASVPATAAYLRQLWSAARLDATSQALHLAAVRDGEAYLMVDYDPVAERPRFSLNLADEGEGGVTMIYDEQGQPRYAIKQWRLLLDKRPCHRLNLYYPDRVEKYISSPSRPEWQPFRLPGEAFPLPWVDRQGAPLGIPLIPFHNRSQGTAFGSSETQDIQPLQDALNKSFADLLSVVDSNAFPLLVAQGFTLGEDFHLAPGTLVEVPARFDGGTADLKLLPGANLQNFIAVLQHLVMEIARVSSTPLSRFQASGQVAAEGTLKQQEAGLIAKVEHKQLAFGNAWEDAMRLALRLENRFGLQRPDAQSSLETLWRPAAPRSEAEHLQSLLLKAQLGVPLPLLLAEAGYGPNADA